jgi:hypothetical protein
MIIIIIMMMMIIIIITVIIIIIIMDPLIIYSAFQKCPNALYNQWRTFTGCIL